MRIIINEKFSGCILGGERKTGWLLSEQAEDAARRAKAQVPADTAFATKPELARAVIAAVTAAAHAGGTPPTCVCAS